MLFNQRGNRLRETSLPKQWRWRLQLYNLTPSERVKNALKYNDFIHAIWWMCNTESLNVTMFLNRMKMCFSTFRNLYEFQFEPMKHSPEKLFIFDFLSEYNRSPTVCSSYQTKRTTVKLDHDHHLQFLVRIKSITDGLLILSDKTHCRKLDHDHVLCDKVPSCLGLHDGLCTSWLFAVLGSVLCACWLSVYE